MRSPANASANELEEKDRQDIFAFSTSWNAFRYKKAKKLVFEIKKLGFQDIELSFNLTAAMVNQIMKLTEEGLIRVVSIHNFCPIPFGLRRKIALPDYYSMSSLDLNQRRLAVKYTKKSIDTAVSVGAKAVVLHSGRVEIEDHTKNLILLYSKNLKNTKSYARVKKDFIKARKEKAGIFLDNTLRSLEQIVEYASKKKIKLGLENRFYYREIPSFAEIGVILERFRGSCLYYWHDVGHAQVMENLGFDVHKHYLDAYGLRMTGVHLHDILGCKDHQAPFQGNFRFQVLKPYLKKDVIKVIEAHYPESGQEIINGVNLLKKIFYGRKYH